MNNNFKDVDLICVMGAYNRRVVLLWRVRAVRETFAQVLNIMQYIRRAEGR